MSEELETFHECLTLEELQQRRNELAAARKNAQLQKEKFKSSKIKQPLWKSVLDFLTK